MSKPNPKSSLRDGNEIYRDTSLFEKSMLLSLIMVVAYIMLQSYSYFREQVEKSTMEQTVAHIQASLNLQMADALMSGRAHEVVGLARGNPFRLLREAPTNYLGEFHDPGTAALPPGNWYFDTRARNMVYLVEYDSHFEGPEGPKTVRFQTVLDYGGGVVVPARMIDSTKLPWGAPQTLMVRAVKPYRWFADAAGPAETQPQPAVK